MSEPRQQKLTDAKLITKRARQHMALYPAAAATPLVRDLKDALEAMILEVEALA